MKNLKFDLQIAVSLILSLLVSAFLMQTVFFPFSPRIRPDWPDQFLAKFSQPFARLRQFLARLRPQPKYTQPVVAEDVAQSLLQKEYNAQSGFTSYTYYLNGRTIELHIPAYLEKPNNEFVSSL